MCFVLPKFYFNNKYNFFNYMTSILDIKQKKKSFHDKYTRHKHRKGYLINILLLIQ